MFYRLLTMNKVVYYVTNFCLINNVSAITRHINKKTHYVSLYRGGGRAGTGSRVIGSTILTGSGRVSGQRLLCLDPLVDPVIGRTKKSGSCPQQLYLCPEHMTVLCWRRLSMRLHPGLTGLRINSGTPLLLQFETWSSSCKSDPPAFHHWHA